MSLSVYFCASVAGGRKYQHIHPFIVDEIKQAATVINENIAQSGCHEKDAKSEPKYVHDKAFRWMKQADAVVAEVTQPSLGVGIELGYFMLTKTPVLCLYQPSAENHLSNMVRGANDDTRFIVKDYNSVEHATRITKDFLHNLNQLNYNVDRHST